jgi:hypothetical protein
LLVKTSIVLFASMVCSVALSADRISMVDNSQEMSVRDAVSSAAQAFSAKDSAGFSMCFKESRREHIRKKCAFSFLEEDATMEILNIHVFSVDDESASAAVKYRMIGAGNSKDVVSEVVLVKEEGRWVISREMIKSSKDSVPQRHALSSSGPRPKNRGNKIDLNSQRPEWDNLNPNVNDISPNLQHLVGDIGIQPGMGCAGGRCANGRCQR